MAQMTIRRKPVLNLKGSPLAYTILYVRDMAKAVDFYKNTLGIPLRFEDAGWSEFELPGKVTLALHPGRKKKTTDFSSVNSILCFHCKDIEGTIKSLKGKGVKFLGPPKTVCPGYRSVEFADLDGNCLSLFGK